VTGRVSPEDALQAAKTFAKEKRDEPERPLRGPKHPAMNRVKDTHRSGLHFFASPASQALISIIFERFSR
jgi:hypothetical protein